MVTDVLQFLTYFAGIPSESVWARWSLFWPWQRPIPRRREISMLDIMGVKSPLSHARFFRGAGRIESMDSVCR